MKNKSKEVLSETTFEELRDVIYLRKTWIKGSRKWIEPQINSQIYPLKLTPEL